MSTPKKEVNLSARDLTLVAAAMNCTKEPINIDYNKLAEAGGFKNANSAKASWHTIKKKLEALSSGAAAVKGGAASGDGGASEPGTPAARTPSKKRKADAVAAAEGENGGGEAAEETPKKGRKADAVTAAEGENGGGEAAEETPKKERKAGVKGEPIAAAAHGEEGGTVESEIKAEAGQAPDGEQSKTPRAKGKEADATAGAVQDEGFKGEAGEV